MRIYIALYLIFSLVDTLTLQNSIKKFQGFIGLYHPYNGSTWEELANETIYDAFQFGISAIYTMPSYGNFLFEDNIKFHCFTANTNFILGMLAPPSEGGVVNNPNDTDIWKPVKPPGLIQSAHRYSEISKICPQIYGITIDDFLYNYPSKISLKDVKDIRGALMGKPVDEYGRVDHDTPATTPWLKLFICFYSTQIETFSQQELVKEIDGVNLWMFDQDDLYTNFESYVDELMNKKLPEGKEIISGVYLKDSRYGWMKPEGVQYVLQKTIELYDSPSLLLHGIFLFAGVFLEKNHITKEQFDDYNLYSVFDKEFYPWLGKGMGTITDSKTSKGIEDASVQLYIEKNEGFVTAARKKTDVNGEVTFDAWAGKSQSSRIIVSVEKENYQSKNVTIKLVPQETVKFLIEMCIL